MVLAHGIGGRPRDWDPVVAAFADRYRVVTFAQAGSTAPTRPCFFRRDTPAPSVSPMT